MEKIKLKTWHKVVIFSLLAVFIIIMAISLFKEKPAVEEKHLPVYSEFRIDIFPYDSCFSMFDDEIIKGDSVSFEIIEGKQQGWIFRIFSVGQKLDYVLSIDLRNSNHQWKKGDTLVLRPDSIFIGKNKIMGDLKVEFTSNFKSGYNSYLTDKIEFSDYNIKIGCNRFDSIATFSGKCKAIKKQLDGPGSKNSMYVDGNFQADAIKVGKRIVN